MVGISNQWVSVIEALLQGPIAWQSPRELARFLGWNLDTTKDILCDLDVNGWIEVWDTDRGVFVTLSPLAASHWNARIIEVGPESTPRWHRIGEPEPIPCRPRGVAGNARQGSLNRVADPSPWPRDPKPESSGFPRMNEPWKRSQKAPCDPPSSLTGLSLTSWPGPGSPAVCPACGMRRLNSQMYCLYCDRWGRDPDFSIAKPIPDPGKPKRILNPEDREIADHRADDKAGADRKAKHQKRMEEQAHLERQRKARAKTIDVGRSPGSNVGG